MEEHVSGSNSSKLSTLRTEGSVEAINDISGSPSDSTLTSNTLDKADSEIEEVIERKASGELTS